MYALKTKTHKFSMSCMKTQVKSNIYFKDIKNIMMKSRNTVIFIKQYNINQ